MRTELEGRGQVGTGLGVDLWRAVVPRGRSVTQRELVAGRSLSPIRAEQRALHQPWGVFTCRGPVLADRPQVLLGILSNLALTRNCPATAGLAGKGLTVNATRYQFNA